MQNGHKFASLVFSMDMVVLLVDPVYQPKMQYWARFRFLGRDRVARFRMPDARQ